MDTLNKSVSDLAEGGKQKRGFCFSHIGTFLCRLRKLFHQSVFMVKTIMVRPAKLDQEEL